MSHKIASTIRDLAESARSLTEGKEFLIGQLSDRLEVAAKRMPGDAALNAMRHMIEVKASKEGPLTILSQKDFQEMYDVVSGLGDRTRFSDELGDLLLQERSAKVASYNDEFISGLRDSGSALDLVDPDLVAEYGMLFSDAPQAAVQSSHFVESGRKSIEAELKEMGFSNASVVVAARNPSHVVYSAQIQARAGMIPFLIPAEIKKGCVLLPSVFVSGDSFVDLTSDNIRVHAHSVISGNLKTATPNAVLATLNKVANVSNVDFSESDYAFLSTQNYYKEFDETPAEELVAQADVEMPEALVDISDAGIRESLLECGLSYSRDVVLAAKKMVSNELLSMGVQYERICVASEFPEGFVLSTNLLGKGGKKTIELPIEVKAEQVLIPGSFISGGSVEEFTGEKVRAFISAEGTGIYDVLSSDKTDLTFKELYSSVLKQASKGDFLDVEDTLKVIGERFGPEYHKIAFTDLISMIDLAYNKAEKPQDEVEEYIKASLKDVDIKEESVRLHNSTLMYIFPEE